VSATPDVSAPRLGLPSDLAHWTMAVRRQLQFYLRTWRYLGLLAFVIVVNGAFTAVQIYYGNSGTSAGDYLYSAIGPLATFGVIVGAFIGGDAIAMDFGSGTGYFMLVLPVRRAVLLLGRYAAAFLATFSLIVVFYLISLVGVVDFYGISAVPWAALAASLGFAALYALAVLATAFLFSAFFRNPTVSMVVTILVLFLAFEVISALLTITPVEPWFVLTYAGQAMALVFESHPHLLITYGMGHRHLEIRTWTPYLWEAAAIMVGYLVVALGLSLTIYQYKESKG
jgi:ABC-type transport system involved in multi-copper enzyme maturation permease subunit